MIRNVKKAGIPAIKYNMSILGVVRIGPTQGRGESKYSIRQMARLALFGLFSFSNLPIALVGLGGGLVCAVALLALASGANAGHAALFFLGGAQLVAVWVLGQYVATVSDEGRRRPLYLVRSAVNVEPRRLDVPT